MIKKEVIDYISNKLNIKNKELIEKDLLLHLVLVKLMKNKYFKDNFVFKGGTCLTKCYLGYYRFSEDLDFTYINQDYFNNKSEKRIRKDLSLIINDIIALLVKITNNLNLEFSEDKTNTNNYDFGANNKFTTFKIWYKSLTTNRKGFIKIQINFVELFKYPLKRRNSINLLENINKKEFLFLFENMNELLEYPKIKVYDIKEILIEKNRAILTRKALKARDFIDIYLILEHLNKNIKLFKNNIVEKTKFMLDKYIKYNENLEVRRKLGFEYTIGDEERLLLKPINKKFGKFTKDLNIFFESIIKSF
ncbi:nucleotidyl transferase AbiEii/AbiGii toxin family protein [archaeon]|nr:nucleotidyl transferase AbiEii/AbiGii toxin family protein [archaeon]